MFSKHWSSMFGTSSLRLDNFIQDSNRFFDNLLGLEPFIYFQKKARVNLKTKGERILWELFETTG